MTSFGFLKALRTKYGDRIVNHPVPRWCWEKKTPHKSPIWWSPSETQKMICPDQVTEYLQGHLVLPAMLEERRAKGVFGLHMSQCGAWSSCIYITYIHHWGQLQHSIRYLSVYMFLYTSESF